MVYMILSLIGAIFTASLHIIDFLIYFIYNFLGNIFIISMNIMQNTTDLRLGYKALNFDEKSYLKFSLKYYLNQTLLKLKSHLKKK